MIRDFLPLILALAVIGGLLYYFESQKAFDRLSEEDIEAANIEIPIETNKARMKADQFRLAKDITSPDAFINSATTSISNLIGDKVILVDFWTYSCINCQRTLPYLNAWYDKYRDHGLEILGIHTPEFGFEEKYANVEQAVKDFGIKFPIVLDNDYSTWQTYENHHWPRKYLIDIDGFIVYDHIGEGAYEETEKKIQELLIERRAALDENGTIPVGFVQPKNVKKVEGDKIRTPEIYFGSKRNDALGNGTRGEEGRFRFIVPPKILPNKLYLVGEWSLTPEYAENQESGARIALRYLAKEVYMVASSDMPVSVRVFLDGEEISEELSGKDVSGGRMTIQKERLYELVKDSDYTEHVLEIEIPDSGFRAFTFTFG